jgi:ABC-type phosphate transport system permease subunit
MDYKLLAVTFTWYLASYFFIVLVHELGHLMSLKSKGITTKVNFKGKDLVVGTNKEWNRLNNDEKSGVLMSGVLFGAFALVFCAIIIRQLGLLGVVMRVMLVFSYLWGIRDDVRGMVKYGDEKNE